MDLIKNIVPIDPKSLVSLGLTLSDNNLIPSIELQGKFNPDEDYVELHAYDLNNQLIFSREDFKDWSNINDPTWALNGYLSSIVLDPTKELEYNFITQGKINTLYNFIGYKLGCSPENPFYISEISPSRREIKLSHTNIDFSSLKNDIKELLLNENINIEEGGIYNKSIHSDEFYIKVGVNRYLIGINILGVEDGILIKLYEPLPSDISIKDLAWVTIKSAETIAFLVEINEILEEIEYIPLKGPNINLGISGYVNDPTNYLNQSNILDTNVSESLYKLNNIIQNRGVTLKIDYGTYEELKFENFIHFSSVESRLRNYYWKVGEIENTDIESKKQSYISSFDGFENFIWNDLELKTITDLDIWYDWVAPQYSDATSSDIDKYGEGIFLEAYLYDNQNPDNLYYTVPEYIRENPENTPYKDFINMTGHFFDIIWLYIKSIAEIPNNTNSLIEGPSLDIISDIVESFGIKIPSSNRSNKDIISSLVGENLSLDTIKKEIYQRLYHNLPYLLKRKGTVEGLRQLINIWGIPSTILRISEFGSKTINQTEDYDYWYDKFNYALKTHKNSHVKVPWDVLQHNFVLESRFLNPDTIAFRFKATYDSESIQTLLIKDSGKLYGYDFGLFLHPDDKLEFSIYDGTQYQSSYIENLDLNNGDWWSVKLNRTERIDQDGDNTTYNQPNTFVLSVKNKIYNGYDGDLLGFEGETIIESNIFNQEDLNRVWNYLGTLYLGGDSNNGFFDGYFQELRYYRIPLTEKVFNNFVMNPKSIEGLEISGSLSSYNTLCFRAPLGTTLINDYDLDPDYFPKQYYSSVHPSFNEISSFIGGIEINSVFDDTFDHTFGANLVLDQNNIYIINIFEYGLDYVVGNNEVYYFNQSNSGVGSRITDKIKVMPSTQTYGEHLSRNISIQKPAFDGGIFNPNVNNVEIAFSPTNEVDDDIIQTYGPKLITDIIADPRLNYTSKDGRYEELRNIALEYFKKYLTSPNYQEYIRISQFFDSALFKLIKDFVPARSSVDVGMVIKPHLLERVKINQPTIEYEEEQYECEYTNPFYIQAGAGGSVNQYNTLDWPPFPQEGFYNGELEGLELIVVDGELNKENIYKKYLPGDDYVWNPSLYSSESAIEGEGNAVYETSESLSGSDDYIGYYSEDNPPITFIDVIFDNGDYNALLNNNSGNRESNLVQVSEYVPAIYWSYPYNLDNIMSGSAIKAEIPDSYYTSKKRTNILYNGVKLQSQNYNTYTEGDISYGKTPVVSKHPIYISSFKHIVADTIKSGYYFIILDTLIEIPNNKIKDINTFVPQTYELGGDNTYINEVSSTFEFDVMTLYSGSNYVPRKCKIISQYSPDTGSIENIYLDQSYNIENMKYDGEEYDNKIIISPINKGLSIDLELLKFGYIVPEDLSSIQKINLPLILNKLRDTSVFEPNVVTK